MTPLMTEKSLLEGAAIDGAVDAADADDDDKLQGFLYHDLQLMSSFILKLN